MKKILVLLAGLLMVSCRDRSAPPTALSAGDVSRDSRSASGETDARQSDPTTNDAATQTQQVDLWDPNDNRDITTRLLERVKQEGVVRIVSILATRDKYVFVAEYEVSARDAPVERPMNKNGSEILRTKRPPLHGTDLWLVNKNGTGLQRLTGDGDSHDPVWSPSGEEIAFISNGSVRIIEGDSVGRDEVFYGSMSSRARGVPVRYSQLRFSPNGKAIAALAKDGTTSWVEVTARSNEVSAHVTFAEGFEHYEWNRESELVLDYGRILFDWEYLGANTEASADTSTLKTDKSGDGQSPLPPKLLKLLLRKLRPYGVMKIGTYAFSPSGNRIVLEGVFDESPQYAGGPPSKDLWLVNRDGSGLRRLTTDHVSYLTEDHISNAPAWSPSGKEIAYTAFGSYSSIGIIDVKTKNARWVSGLQARNPGAQGTHASWNWGYVAPRWSPNNKVIAAVGRDGEGDDWITAVEARSGNMLFQTNGGGYSFSWRHDGELVIPTLGKFVFDWNSALFKRR